jgi:hypothetical protein
MIEPSRAPDWDGADPAASLRAYARWVLETARLTFLKDGTHVELFFLFKSGGLAGIQPAPVGLEREAVAHAVRAAVRQHDLMGVIHVAEAWTFLPSGPDDPNWKKLMEGSTSVSQLDGKDRVETLLVRMEGSDGQSLLWLNQIVRKEDGLALGEPLEVDQPPAGRLGSYFHEPPMDGW